MLFVVCTALLHKGSLAYILGFGIYHMQVLHGLCVELCAFIRLDDAVGW